MRPLSNFKWPVKTDHPFFKKRLFQGLKLLPASIAFVALMAVSFQPVLATGPTGEVTVLTAANGDTYRVCFACDNVINGGLVQGDEAGCPNPTWDPSVIASVLLPTGGSGALEFLWIFTTDDPNSPFAHWEPIPNTNSPSYDPGPISVTTYFRRCARRAGCTDYVGETNIVEKLSNCCNIQTAITSSPVTCAGGSDGSIDLTVTGSTLPNQYSWSPNLGNVEDPQNLSAGTYSVTITDAFGCTATASVNIDDGSILSLSAQGVNETCLGANDGSALVTGVTGGSPPYSYLWSDPFAQTTPTISNLSPGLYTVTVTDANGCSAVASVQVNLGQPLDVQITSTDVACFGGSSGTATVASVNGFPPFSYQWNDPASQTTATATGLSAGTYTVLVTDGQGCVGTGSVTLSPGNQLVLTTQHTDTQCGNTPDGTASVQASGGAEPYAYLWNDPASQTNATAIGLATGSYTVTVTDANGCSATASVTIQSPMATQLSLAATPVSCNGGSNGSVSVTVLNGNPADFTYQWDDPSNSTGQIVTGLPAGVYSVTVSDAQGCSAIGNTTVLQPSALFLNIQPDSASCSDTPDGSAMATVSGGTPFPGGTYNYLWNAPGNPATPHLTNVLPGTYSVTVTDANGCTTSGNTTISAPPKLTLAGNSIPATCQSATNGSASVSVFGGTPPYNYQWDDPDAQTTANISNILPGNYQVFVTDANGCTAFIVVSVGFVPSFSVQVSAQNVTCNGLNNGTAAATITGSPVGSVSYLWNDPASSTTSAVSNLAPGVYSVTVTDSMGCTQTAAASISQPAPLSLSISKTDVVCTTDTNGTATAIVSGGTQPYTFIWSGGQTSSSISGLAVGSYSLTVSDANGCSANTSINIVATSLLSSSTSSTDAQCFGGSDGSATAIGLGGFEPYFYTWSNGATGSTITGLAAGTYYVTVTDNAGCWIVDTAVVSQPTALNCTTQLVAEITTFGGSDGSAQVTGSGGSAPYSFSWSNGSSSQTATNLSAGNYSVTLTDNHGCTCVTHINMKNPSKIGNFVWNDLDQDGIQDPGEPGLAGVSVQLEGTTGAGTAVSLTTVSDASGNYAFDGLKEGFYKLTFSLLPNSLFSPQNAGDDNLDSDVDPATGSTGFFALGPSYFASHWDAGIIVLDEKINLGDRVWNDFNRNGIQDPFENGVQGVFVRLLSSPGNSLIATKTTNLLGLYLFENVMPGNYVIEFSLPSLPTGYVISAQYQGSNDALDSNPNPATGRTDVITVLPFTLDNLTIDCGIYKECDNVTDGGLIGYDEDLCGIGADPAPIVNVAFPSGGFGNLEYLWMYSHVPVWNGPGDPNWFPIPNSNSPTYDPGPIGQTTYYIRCVRREGCEDYIGETNIVAKKVTPYPLTQIVSAPTELCINEGGRFEAAIAGGGATYFWQFGPGAVPATADTRVVDVVYWTTLGQKTVSLTVTRFGCSFTVTTVVSVNNCTVPLIVIDDLTAAMLGDKAVLNWNVTGDSKQALFFIEHSENGTHFQTVGIVGGTGGSLFSAYKFVHESPRLGDNYYRIRYKLLSDTPLEGYSEMVLVYCEPEGVGIVQVYPNPTRGKATVELLKPGEAPLQVELYNVSGKVLQRMILSAKTEKFEIDLSQLPAGFYLVKINQEGYREQIRRVVKVE